MAVCTARLSAISSNRACFSASPSAASNCCEQLFDETMLLLQKCDGVHASFVSLSMGSSPFSRSTVRAESSTGGATARATYLSARGGADMKAIVYKGPRTGAVENVDDPKLESASDCIVRITSTGICGSDLHMYEGRTSVAKGTIFGHENMGIVEEVGRSGGHRSRKAIAWSCRSTSPAASASTVCAASPRPASSSTPTARRARTATRRWDRTPAARPSTCACRLPTSTA